MRILWLCNAIDPAGAQKIGISGSPLAGWISSVIDNIKCDKDISLTYLFEYSDELLNYNDGNVKYISFSNWSEIKFKASLVCRFKEIIKDTKPDVIHIWGTEYAHSYAMVLAASELEIVGKLVISIQGLTSICGHYHYFEGLPFHIIHMYTVRDLLRCDNIYHAGKRFVRRGENEIHALQLAKHVIGRTDWDQAIALQYNPNIKYHFCNESLRNSFYREKWDITKVNRHTIFFSQCNYPIKGFHYMLHAMGDILKKYPDVHIYTTGDDLLNLNLKSIIRLNSYQKYLIHLIKKYHLEGHITFLGLLSEREMLEQYLSAHVFVSASTSENSSNSICEAMLVGCPVVASDVGGTKNLLEHNKEGYVYQCSAPYMLAYYVNKIFGDDLLADKFSINARKHALITHNRQINYENLMRIYEELR